MMETRSQSPQIHAPSTDQELLREFARHRSNEAFTSLVQRHLNHVHATALRRVGGDAHLARDVAQTVFCDVARKAQALARHPAFASWLHRSTCFAAAKLVRAEQRRRSRETAGLTMQKLTEPESLDYLWSLVRPVLDDVLSALREGDREAILLRYFLGYSLAQVGARLNVSENAARMRIDRALERLRVQLERRDIVSSGSVLAMVLATGSASAAPAGLATTISSAALVSVTTGSGLAALLPWVASSKLPLALSTAALVTSAVFVHREATLQAELSAAIATANLRSDSLDSRPEVRSENDRPADARVLRWLTSAIADARRSESTGLVENTPETIRAGYFEVSALDAPPVAQVQIRPQVPLELRRAGINGEVKLRYVVSSEGRVENIEVLESSHRAYQIAAIEALKEWRFTPGMKDGAAVRTRVVLPFVFQFQQPQENWF